MEDEVIVGACDHPEKKGPYYLQAASNLGGRSLTIEICLVCGVLLEKKK